jgi:hypothetical protein
LSEYFYPGIQKGLLLNWVHLNSTKKINIYIYTNTNGSHKLKQTKGQTHWKNGPKKVLIIKIILDKKN